MLESGVRANLCHFPSSSLSLLSIRGRQWGTNVMLASLPFITIQRTVATSAILQARRETK